MARTVVVTMSFELEDIEDAQQTAEIAVELLQAAMDNQVTLIDVDDTDGKEL